MVTVLICNTCMTAYMMNLHVGNVKEVFLHVRQMFCPPPHHSHWNPKNHMAYISFTGTPAAALFGYEFISQVDTEKAGRL